MRAHGKIFDSVTDTIGNTPMVRMDRLARQAGCDATILAKLEFFNPLGSVKDRIALAMIETMEASGLVTSDTVIIEPTAGNTGIGLAFVCAAKGLACVFTMPEGFSVERIKLMRLLGATVVLTPNEDGIAGAIDRANEIAANTPHAVIPWQYGNPANPEVHRTTTASEIWTDTGGKIDAVVIGVGTGGTLTGVGEALKALNPKLQIIAVEPDTSAVISGGPHFPHAIQGIGTGFIPDVLNLDVIDEVMTVSSSDATKTARRCAAVEGVPCGLSSGAALACALRLGQRASMQGQTIAVILPSFAERYLTTALFDNLGVH